MAIVRRTLFSDAFSSANTTLGSPNYTTDGAADNMTVDNNNVATTVGTVASGVRVLALVNGSEQWVEGTLNARVTNSNYAVYIATGLNTVGYGYYIAVTTDTVYVGAGNLSIYSQASYTGQPGDVFRLEYRVVNVDVPAQRIDIDLIAYVNDVELIVTNNGGDYSAGESAGMAILPDSVNSTHFGWTNFSVGDWVETGVTPIVTNVNGVDNSARTQGQFVINGSSLTAITSVSVQNQHGLHNYPLTVSSQSDTVIQCAIWDIHNTKLPFGTITLALTHSDGTIVHNFALEHYYTQQVAVGASLDYTYGLAQSNISNANAGDLWEMPRYPGNAGFEATLYDDTNILFVPGPTTTHTWTYWNYTYQNAQWERGVVTLAGITVPDYEAVNKPVLPSIWAESGTRVPPPANIKDTGWVAELPSAEYENYLEHRQDRYIHHLNERGFPEWDQFTDYLANAYCYYVDNVYIALRANTNTEPVKNLLDWTRWDHQFEPSGLIKMWYGGSSLPSGWVLCDGTQGTLDLRDRFLKASNSTGSNAGIITGGTANTISDNSPSHDHGGTSSSSGVISPGTTSINASHTHPVPQEPGHTHTGSCSATTLSKDQLPIHSHGFRKTYSPGAAGSGTGSVFSESRVTSSAGLGTSHKHPVVVYDSKNHNHYGNTSSDGTHSHTTPSAPNHSHNVGANTAHSHNVLDPLPEYVTVVYIQKV